MAGVNSNEDLTTWLWNEQQSMAGEEVDVPPHPYDGTEFGSSKIRKQGALSFSGSTDSTSPRKRLRTMKAPVDHPEMSSSSLRCLLVHRNLGWDEVDLNNLEALFPLSEDSRASSTSGCKPMRQDEQTSAAAKTPATTRKQKVVKEEGSGTTSDEESDEGTFAHSSGTGSRVKFESEHNKSLRTFVKQELCGSICVGAHGTPGKNDVKCETPKVEKLVSVKKERQKFAGKRKTTKFERPVVKSECGTTLPHSGSTVKAENSTVPQSEPETPLGGTTLPAEELGMHFSPSCPSVKAENSTVQYERSGAVVKCEVGMVTGEWAGEVPAAKSENEGDGAVRVKVEDNVEEMGAGDGAGLGELLCAEEELQELPDDILEQILECVAKEEKGRLLLEVATNNNLRRKESGFTFDGTIRSIPLAFRKQVFARLLYDPQMRGIYHRLRKNRAVSDLPSRFEMPPTLEALVSSGLSEDITEMSMELDDNLEDGRCHWHIAVRLHGSWVRWKTSACSFCGSNFSRFMYSLSKYAEWRLITRKTTAGGAPWELLEGQTLCEPCYSRFQKAHKLDNISRPPAAVPKRVHARPWGESFASAPSTHPSPSHTHTPAHTPSHASQASHAWSPSHVSASYPASYLSSPAHHLYSPAPSYTSGLGSEGLWTSPARTSLEPSLDPSHPHPADEHQYLSFLPPQPPLMLPGALELS